MGKASPKIIALLQASRISNRDGAISLMVPEEVFLRKAMETNWTFYIFHKTDKPQRISSYYGTGT